MKILYLYQNPCEETYKKILAGELPSNHLFGFVELQKLGYNVSFKDSQLRGPLRKITGYLNKRFSFYLKDFKLLYDLKNYDVIVVKGKFSTSTTIACRLFNKKIVYIDPILTVPRNYLRKSLFRINLNLADGTVVFTRTQFELIPKSYKVSNARLKFIPFCLDAEFYKPLKKIERHSKPFILSIGMDPGRDYDTLIKSIDGLNIDLKIVALPYLLNGLTADKPNIQVFSKIPYKQLFELYSESSFVVIPLKKLANQYPSGITNLLEAKLLGKAVISTFSSPLEEYLEHENGVYYVDAESVTSLRQAIIKFLQHPEFCATIQNKGTEVIATNYNTSIFANLFGTYLSNLFDGNRVSNSE